MKKMKKQTVESIKDFENKYYNVVMEIENYKPVKRLSPDELLELSDNFYYGRISIILKHIINNHSTNNFINVLLKTLFSGRNFESVSEDISNYSDPKEFDDLYSPSEETKDYYSIGDAIYYLLTKGDRITDETFNSIFDFNNLKINMIISLLLLLYKFYGNEYVMSIKEKIHTISNEQNKQIEEIYQTYLLCKR